MIKKILENHTKIIDIIEKSQKNPRKAASQFLNPVSINLTKLPQMPASRFLKIVQETGQIPVCSFYLPVSTSRNHPVSSYCILHDTICRQCNTLQHTATRCNTTATTDTATHYTAPQRILQYIVSIRMIYDVYKTQCLQTLQHIKPHCNALQHITTHCNTLDSTLYESNK